MRYLIILLIAISLTSCMMVSPNDLGISNEQWKQYSPEQRETMIKNYEHVKKVRNQALKNHKFGNTLLLVSIKDGTVFMPPFTEQVTFAPLVFTIRSGECTNQIIYSNKKPVRKVNLGACYLNDILSLDPSPYDINKSQGSIFFPYVPLWKRGFTYSNIDSSGLARLNHVNIDIKVNQEK